jgi:excinuclease ABC subunit B
MQQALEETSRRREKQQAYNATHGITPETVRKNMTDVLSSVFERDHVTVPLADATPHLSGKALEQNKNKLRLQMMEAASNLEFELAAKLRDELHALENSEVMW